ncbi:hypothetical protein B0H13DRAFT_1879750 [Mycena leptocephala]|nr:hypothetical protein B0H13DRAFT_1879750 [Mycena leptocephala]
MTVCGIEIIRVSRRPDGTSASRRKAQAQPKPAKQHPSSIRHPCKSVGINAYPIHIWTKQHPRMIIRIWSIHATQLCQSPGNVQKAAGNPFILEGIAVNATEAEAACPGASKEAKEGLVYNLDSHSTVKRGQNKHQTDVYPLTLRATAQNPHPPVPTTLALQKITYAHCAMILHFGTLFFMIQYLTHTSVQFYPRECWERSIRNVSKTVRFKMCVAFIFASHVLAFPSLNLVFQPTWATSLTDFTFPPNIFTSPPDYLVLVAQWIEALLLKPRHTCACDTIHECNTLFYGLSPFLTVHEVFSNPSRTAHFLAAFYLTPLNSVSAMRIGLDEFHEGDLLTLFHHTDYIQLKLEELGNLDKIWGCDSDVQLFDVFEPTFLAAGLKSETNLGHLIFGKDAWLAAGGTRSIEDDPITTLYRKYGKFYILSTDLISAPTMLKADVYTPLSLAHAEFRGKKSSHRPTFTFHDPKEMWSITQNFPANSHWSSDPQSVGFERDRARWWFAGSGMKWSRVWKQGHQVWWKERRCEHWYLGWQESRVSVEGPLQGSG